MAIEYRSQPAHIKTLIQQHGIRFVGWDLDGTLANTERLHREICRSALQEIGNITIPEREFRQPHYRAAFGLPGGETSLRLAQTLREKEPTAFQHALRYSLARGISGDSCETVANALTKLRNETFDFYIRNVSLRQIDEDGGILQLVVSAPSNINDQQTLRRLNVLKDVQVHTYPHVLSALNTFERHGLKQGICTSSGERFVYPLIEALDLQDYFAGVVTADCVPSGEHKPAPFPWHKLRSRLDDDVETMNQLTPIEDMLFIENSAGGGFSSIRAGKGPTFVIADNTPATIGKLMAKIEASRSSTSPLDIHGTAIFIDDLGKLVLPNGDAKDLLEISARTDTPVEVVSTMH